MTQIDADLEPRESAHGSATRIGFVELGFRKDCNVIPSRLLCTRNFSADGAEKSVSGADTSFLPSAFICADLWIISRLADLVSIARVRVRCVRIGSSACDFDALRRKIQLS